MLHLINQTVSSSGHGEDAWREVESACVRMSIKFLVILMLVEAWQVNRRESVHVMVPYV